MPAKWRRAKSISTPQPPSIGQIQSVAAKSHWTVFARSPRAPGAGRTEVKEGFSTCAKTTIGEPDRMKRNAKLKTCLVALKLKTGVIRKKSRAKSGSPLHGKVYVFKPGAAVTME